MFIWTIFKSHKLSLLLEHGSRAELCHPQKYVSTFQLRETSKSGFLKQWKVNCLKKNDSVELSFGVAFKRQSANHCSCTKMFLVLFRLLLCFGWMLHKIYTWHTHLVSPWLRRFRWKADPMSFLHEYPQADVPSAPISSPVLNMEKKDSRAGLTTSIPGEILIEYNWIS